MLAEFKKTFKEEGGAYIRVKALPNAGKTEIKGLGEDGTLKVALAAPPEKGKANKELVAFLAKEFAVGRDNVKILSGAGERLKLVKIVKVK